MPAAFAYPLPMTTLIGPTRRSPNPLWTGGACIVREDGYRRLSSINGMFYIRGHPSDYDRWARSGLEAGPRPIAAVLPPRRNQAHGDDAYHGRSGPLDVSHGRDAAILCSRVDRCRSAGRLRDDARYERPPAGRPRADGPDHVRRTPLERRKAYLRPAQRPPNSRRSAGALSRVLFEGVGPLRWSICIAASVKMRGRRAK